MYCGPHPVSEPSHWGTFSPSIQNLGPLKRLRNSPPVSTLEIISASLVFRFFLKKEKKE